MTENMKKLLELASTNEEWKKQLETATKETLIRLAKEKGIELAEADFTAEAEISEDELEAVAGGQECYCVVGGGGTGDDATKTCACVLGGGGQMKERVTRCKCPVVGMGGNEED